MRLINQESHRYEFNRHAGGFTIYQTPRPERTVVEFYENRKSKAKPVFALAARTTYTYGAFRQFGVTTDETVATPAGR